MNIKSIRVGDCYIPDLTLPEEPRPIGRWGRMHRDYLILNPGDENGIELQIQQRGIGSLHPIREPAKVVGGT